MKNIPLVLVILSLLFSGIAQERENRDYRAELDLLGGFPLFAFAPDGTCWLTSGRGNRLSVGDIANFNEQYGGLTVRESPNFHDRFLVIDDRALYLIGASLKDLGHKCFAFTRLDSSEIPRLKSRI